MAHRDARTVSGAFNLTGSLLPLGAALSVGITALGCEGGVLRGGSADGSSSRGNGDGDSASGDGDTGGDGDFSDPTQTPPGVDGIGWSTRYPRLSHKQWENTVRDLLRLSDKPGLADTFSLDPDDSRFDTTGTHIVSSNLWTDYQRAAEAIAAQVADDPDSLDRLVPGANDAASFVGGFLPRAFRREVSADELSAYQNIYETGVTSGDGASAHANGAQLVIAGALQSPHFLYRPEISTEVDGDRVWLNPFEVANRLSFALWNSMPSDDLLEAAQSDGLGTADQVIDWARQLLQDERAMSSLVSFHEQFFHTKDYGTIAKNETLFPTFTLDLAPVLQAEADLFIEDVTVNQDRGIAELLTSNVTYVNDEIAGFYGLEGSFGSEMTRVELDATRRAGILTQLGFLSRFGSQTQSDPILRGVHVSLEMLCSQLPAPPNDIPPLPEFEPDQTNRERVELATAELPCSNCHEPVINPLGFAFEHYDAIGAWRDTDNGQPVDATASYNLDGEVVNYDGAVELIRLLAESPSLHRCYADAWLEYLMGRPVADEEIDPVTNMGEVSRTQEAASTLLTSLVSLDTFRARPQENF